MIDVFVGSLSNEDRRVLVAHRTLDALEHAVRTHAATDDATALLWPCPQCSAGVGRPCTNRRAPGRSHAPRTDRMLRATRLDVVRWCRNDLLHGRAPRDVLDTIHRHPLVRRLVELGHLARGPGARQARDASAAPRGAE